MTGWPNQGVSDLSWLAVDEADYRAAEVLPKQNLDIIPEFQKALISDTKEGSLDVQDLPETGKTEKSLS